MKPTKILAAIAALLISVACNGNNKQETKATQNNNMKQGKTLIVFFSHAGENYAVGNIKVSNTKIVADYIKGKTGADQFEIVAEKSYDMPYSDLTALAKK